MRILDLLVKAIDRLSGLVGGFAAICVCCQVFAVVYEIVMRNFFNRPTLWSFTFSTYLLIAVGLLGASYAQLNARHVNVTLVYSRLPRRVQVVLGIVMYVMTLVIFLSVLTWLGLKMFMNSLATDSVDPFASLRWPLWSVYWIVPAGGFFMILQVISTIYKLATDFEKRKDIGDSVASPPSKEM